MPQAIYFKHLEVLFWKSPFYNINYNCSNDEGSSNHLRNSCPMVCGWSSCIKWSPLPGFTASKLGKFCWDWIVHLISICLTLNIIRKHKCNFPSPFIFLNIFEEKANPWIIKSLRTYNTINSACMDFLRTCVFSMRLFSCFFWKRDCCSYRLAFCMPFAKLSWL